MNAPGPQPDLFAVEPSLSPRLRWMQLNHVRTHESPWSRAEVKWSAWLPENDDDVGGSSPYDPGQCGYGASEQAAVEELAHVLGVVNWGNCGAQPPPLC